jgi:5-methylcytosine-specific restriction enzyme subunit McrC
MSYHRLNEHYREAHGLSWLLLDGLGTKDVLAPGQASCFAFLIDMNRIFESFVHRLVERLLAGTGTRVHYQRGDRSIILNAGTNQPYSRVVPDLLVEAPGPGGVARIAVDAKYKLYDERKLSSGDVYQGFVYAYAYGAGTGRTLSAALLLYPSSTKSNQAVRLRVRSAQTLVAAEILALGLSIPSILEELVAAKLGPATKQLIEALRHGLGASQQAVA